MLALLTAFGSVAGFLYKFRGAREAPEVELRRPWHSTVELFRSPLYALGIVIALGSWGLHVGALTLAPISLVQSVIAGGLVLLTVVADQLFGIPVTRREWICVGLTAAGLAFLAATLDGDAGSAHSHYDPATLAIFLVDRRRALGPRCWRRPGRARPAMLAVSAGLLWATSDTSIKALSSHLGALGFGVRDPSARVRDPGRVAGRPADLGPQPAARRRGADDRADLAAANLTTIAAGPIVFGEPLPASRLGLAVRILAFVLVIVAAALTPPPAASARPLESAMPPSRGDPGRASACRPTSYAAISDATEL